MTSTKLLAPPNIERAVSATTGAFLVGSALRKRGIVGLALGSLGATLLVQAARGRPSLFRVRTRHLQIHREITVHATPAELYSFWHDFENIPRFMTHVASVRVLDETASEWTVAGPGDARIRWRAEIVEDRPNELISWQSVDRSPIVQKASVRFQTAPQEGTEVHFTLEYGPPPGTVGIVVREMLVGVTAPILQEELRHLKQLYESGSIPTTEGQPHGRRGRARKIAERFKRVSKSESPEHVPLGTGFRSEVPA